MVGETLRLRYQRIHNSVTRKLFYIKAFIITTFAMFYSTKILRCLYNMLPRPAWEIGLTAVWLTGCVLYLSLKAVVTGDVVDCPHVPVRFLKSVLTHHIITVTCFLLQT